jgi:hypothetical protein
MPYKRPSARLASPEQWLAVALATVLVAGAPIALVWWLRESGIVASPILAVILGMGLSLCVSRIGCLLWEKRPGSEDLLFSELMIWGFLHRLRTQRRLACALDMVGPLDEARSASLAGLSAREQARLLETLVSGIETRDPYLHGHSRRVARHAWMIARRMGLTREEVARVRTAAAIHDLGKLQTPKAVLHKAGRLTDEEYTVIKQHPDDGAEMSIVLGDPQLTAMVRHHHERLDGTGYPCGLAGEEIPLGARIIAVADTFDAITSSRPYRAASPHRKAMDILHEDADTRLDPVVVRAFCSHYAGRRPVAAWSSLAGLPERALSWLSGGAANVAAVAKTALVAALVGATAATTATLTPPPVKHPSPVAGLAAKLLPAQRPDAAKSKTAPAASSHDGASAKGQPRRRASAHRASGPDVLAGTSHAALANATAQAAQAAQTGEPVRQGSGGETGGGEVPRGGAKHEEGHHTGEETKGSGKAEAPHAKSEEAKSESGGETRGKDTPTAGKSEGGKGEETHGKAKEVVEGAGGKVKEVVQGTGEAVKEVTESTGGKAKEVVQGTGETVKEVVKGTGGAVTEVTEETHAKVEEVVGKVKEVLKLK